FPPGTDRSGDGRPALQCPDLALRIMVGEAGFEEGRTTPGHLPSGTEHAREFRHPGLDCDGRACELVLSVAPDLVPRAVDGGCRERKAGPGERVPALSSRFGSKELPTSGGGRGPANQEERHVSAQAGGDLLEVTVQAV